MGEKKYAVYTPNQEFSGRRFGVIFEDGKGMATEHQAVVLVKNWGYSCPELFLEEGTPPLVPPQGGNGDEPPAGEPTSDPSQDGDLADGDGDQEEGTSPLVPPQGGNGDEPPAEGSVDPGKKKKKKK